MTTSPFARIDPDCLLTIFDIITSRIPAHNDDSQIDSETDRVRPLSVVRNASQVCRQWREIVIGSPWIWGRVVDLGDEWQHGSKTTREWMDIVVQRARSSPLWISGIISEPQENSAVFDTQAYFIALLGSWERVEKLSVVIHGQEIPEEIWSSFLSRAPILKLFDVQLLSNLSALKQVSTTKLSRLFANHAPSLREIRADWIRFKVDWPWLCHIRKITPPWRFVDDIFVLLRHCPNLESVVIKPSDRYPLWSEATTTSHVSDHRPANLPSLLTVDIAAELEDSARILEHLRMCNPSVLRLNISNYGHDSKDDNVLSLLRKNLTSQILRHFTTVSVKEIRLIIMASSRFEFIDMTRRNYNEFAELSVIIHHSTMDKNQQAGFNASLLDIVAQASDSTLGTNTPIFQTTNQITVQLEDIHPTLYRGLYSMFAMLDNVELLTVHEMSTDALSEVNEAIGHEGRTVLFPKLKTLCLFNELWYSGSQKHTGLTKFLTWRQEIGLPVAKLDLTKCNDLSNYAQDLTVLEDVSGLEVVWERRCPGDDSTQGGDDGNGHYICGSADAEQRGHLALCEQSSPNRFGEPRTTNHEPHEAW